MTAARLKEIGAEGMVAPIRTTCAEHSGQHRLFIASWDGKKWVKSSTGSRRSRPGQALINKEAQGYATSTAGWPKRTEACDKASLKRDPLRLSLSPLAGRGWRDARRAGLTAYR